MKKILLLLMISQLCFSQVFETVPILENGPRDKRINMVILGDGFTAGQQADFVADASNLVDYLFNKSPFNQYKNYFNVYAVKVISAESGVKHPGTATDVTEPVFAVSNPNNFLGTTFDVGVHRCVYSNTTNVVSSVLASNVPDFDIAFVLGNSPEYGGCGGTYAFVSNHPSASEIVVHELGHSFGKLADEYWFSGTGESPNKTKNNNAATNKWKNWIGINNVGIFPYTESPTWFRPHQNCEMRFLDREFCSVCKQQLVERVHTLQNPIDSFTPTNSSAINLTGPITFSVNEILPVPNTLANTWSVNGTAISETSNVATLSPSDFINGVNTVLFTVVDKNTLLKVDNHENLHVSTISWSVTKTLAVVDINASQRNFQVYPNPAKSQIFIKDETKNLKNITVEIYDASGRNLKSPRVQNLSANEVSVNVEGLLPQSYIIKVYENKTLILTQKIIKE
ncbi:peptidase M64 domain-containing protein [Kaistella antarctica]|uniref:Por secretion system C-terminal sorting domain n=1 Tax=Kaistella antarctica TaxID=266748 RepID=A0A448NU92_9FLAO|nr:peptidase M64 domain-containing protein [Kaistella antarctica]KEY18442.1 von Willebrand factor A [Kaistella antarctica]SEV85803.1 Por secretion system C-terminal sorting domain-containing protein [Kaistella antarctica]VEI01211.1 Por secretion system C-terminal sorting domain [Kaistella antarctica]